MGVLDSDPRKAYVLSTVVDAIASGDQKAPLLDRLAQENSPAVASFLDDASVNLVQASVSGISSGSPTVVFSNTPQFPEGCEYQLLMAKLSAGPLRATDIPTNVVVSSVAHSPLASLYHTLRTVYSPLIAQPAAAAPNGVANGNGHAGPIAGDPKLQDLLAQLEAGLGTALRGGGKASAQSVAGPEGPDKASLLGVLRPEDEFQMWAELAGGSSSMNLQRRAGELSRHFDPLWRPFADVTKGAGVTEESVLELLDNTEEALEAVWATKASEGPDGWAYQQRRMEHLLNLIGSAMMGFVQASVRGINIWNANFREVEEKLRAGQRIIGRWEHVTNELTAMQWATSGPGRHSWKGTYSDADVAAFRERLDECIKMREANEELRKLLTPEEANSLNVDHVFSPFALVNALHISEYVEPLWAAAKEEYERRMEPIENRLSQKLKELFGSVLIPSLTASISKHGDRGGAVAQPHQVFREFKRYGGLLSRPLISEKLQTEKDTLAKQVDTHLENILRDFQAREDQAARNIKSGTSPASGRNLPQVVDHIVWALQALSKVEETDHALGSLTAAEEGNGSALGQCLVLCQDLRKDILEFKNGQYKNWGEEVMDRLEEIKLEKTGRLMDFHVADGHVNLHFNDELVSLLREVRALQALGFSIPSSIQAEVATANKFYRQGMVLKQVGNFYNDIATQMIPCQKPMMLEDAKRFEDVLTNPRDGLGKPLTWANVSALDNYVQRLQEVANQLTEKNRKLRKWHKVLGDKVQTLMGTDLVRARDKWVQGIKEIRAIFNNLENEGFSRASQANWRLHWDYQIYKALEYQYSRGLECLNETLPQMELKMVFKQRKLQYDPPLEEQRTTHYKQHIKTFIALPLNLKGVSDMSERPGFFRHMVDAASGGIAKVYTNAEILFAKLQEELKRLQDWVALGTVDLDSFVDERLEEVSDWELNFKYLKLAAKEAEKIQPDVKIDCYTVSLMPVKTVIEEHMKSLQEVLIASLRRKTAAEKAEVEDFVKNGKDALEQQFTSVEEIGKARANAKEMIGNVSHILNLRRKVEEKNKLIRQMAQAIGSSAGGVNASSAAVDMSDLNNEWETFQTKLQQHETHLEDQKNHLKGQIERNINEFKSKVNGFSARWFEFKPKGAPEGDPQLMLAKMEDDALSLQELLEEAKRMSEECEHFQMDPPDFQALEDVAADIDATKIAWSRYGEFLKDRDDLAKRDWISMRDEVWRVEDFLAKWQETGKVAGKIASTDPVAMILMKEIDAYRRAIPNLKYVRGNGWEKKHWNKLFDMIQLPTKGPNAVTPENLTLAHFLDKADNLAKAAEDIKELDSQAQGESVLRKALDELNAWGYDRRFNITEHVSTAGGGSRRTALIKEWKDILTEVGDHQSLVGSLKQSKYFPNFKDETTAWEVRLANLQDGLASLNQIQRKWVYLEPIFARGALPQQQARFRRVDDEFRGLMATVESNTMVTHFADVPRLNDILPQMVSQLEICQKALADFLEEKRQVFPRFYFIGDDDLLEILGQSKNPEVIQTHLKKLFAGIHSVVFNEDSSVIRAMQSIEKEVVPLATPVEVTDGVEAWLNELAKSMKQTLRGTLPGCMKAKDFKGHPSQLLNLADMASFTARAESAIQRGTLPQLQQELRGLLQEYTGADYTGYRVMQLKIQALVLDLIHNIEIVDQLVAARCQDLQDWAWSKQLRYYSSESGDCRVRMAEGDFEYTYEYQGNAPKLVYTPLTDKCYLTLTQGMALGYGGNPYGPAGTGKTESVKALGQAMARQVLVFNCDEQFDFKSMGRIFLGLVKCGAWGCFDEFNRLEEEVLSAVSQQIQQIQGALKDRTPSMEFMGNQSAVDFNAGIFVTLNPAGKGYGGRSKLPDNLKQLFRSVAMTVPDNELIAEVRPQLSTGIWRAANQPLQAAELVLLQVLLLSEGIRAARDIGRKTVSLFKLSKQLLTPQQHYDWGLRALKTVLGIAGRLLQERRGNGTGGPTPEEETDLVLQAVKVTTLPKLTYGDNERFLRLLADVFPGASHSSTSDPEVEDAIMKAMEEMHLEPLPAQVEKVLQLHLASVQRIGIIVVGPSGAGKSTLWRILEAAYRHMGRPVKTHIMNPKAMHRQRLLGHMDLDTREMFDGVLTAASRQVVKEPLEQHSWIICDGDVDPEWIESLNSVLDDNRLLTLPSGERIQFASNVNFIFECHSLEFASPATVSRCGMLYLSEENIDVGRLLTAWLKRCPDNMQTNLSTWIHDYFHKAIEWTEQQSLAVESSKLGLVHSALSQIQGASTKREFCVGLAKGLGANMTAEVRQELLSFLTRCTGEGDLLATPQGATIHSIIRGEDDAMGGGEGTGSLVVTRDTLVNASLVACWLRRGEPVLLVGPEGCGKNVLLEQCFAELRGTATAVVNCSAQTTAENAIQKLSQMCGKPVSTNTGRVLRPRDSDRLILYLKDINLPRPDKYKTIQLISFLQQIITYNGFYDDNLEFIGLERVQIVASMNPSTTVGRHPISTRFTAIARCAYMTYPDRDQLLQVYSRLLRNALVDAAEHNQTWASDASAAKLAGTMLDVYDGVKRSFSPDDHRHYQFTPRNLTEWVRGLQRLDSGVEVLDGFAYEANRIFRDRLVGEDAQANFDSLLRQAMTLQWQWSGPSGGQDALLSTLGATVEERLDGKLTPSMSQWAGDDFAELVAGKLKQFEREQQELGLLLFPEVLQRVAALDRVLSTPGGSVLMCGRAGVGRRSATSLVAYIHHMELFSPSITATYDTKAFRNDLKTIMQKAGVDNVPVLMFMEDHHIIDNSFLEYVNSLLSGGEVPGLFSNEELEGILAPLREAMASEGFQYSSPFEFFTARVRRNLRIVLSMDPTNPLYRERCEANPALFTRCCIIWSENWARSALQALPAARLEEVLKASDEEQRQQVIENLISIYETMLDRGATPRHYCTQVEMYKRIYQRKREELVQQQSFLKSGLSKLAEAEATVDTLSREANIQQKELGVKESEANEAMQRITVSIGEASERRKEVEELQKRLAVEEGQLHEQKGGIEQELQEVQPMLDQAKKAVGQIKSDNINEIRSFKMPPDAIRDVLEGVLRVLGQQDMSWANMKKFLGSRAVKDEIINFDAHKITPAIRRDVDKLLQAKASSFEHAVIYRVSVAAAPLAAWVKANIRFSIVLEKIAPLEKMLGTLTASLDSSRVRLTECEEELAVLDSRVVELKEDFSKKTGEAESLKIGLKKAKDTLEAAENLLGKLSGEKGRWVTQVDSLDEQIRELPTYSLMASGFVTYLPAHPEDVRLEVQRAWATMLQAPPGYDLRRFMSSESEMLVWKSEGLPGDDLSMENGVAILNSSLSALVIDPGATASDWLRDHLSKGGAPVESATMHDPRFANTLELAVRFGKTLVVTEVDEVAPVLYPLLRGDLRRSGPRFAVQLGDKLVDYNEAFRLYLITRNPAINIPPDAAPLVGITNFTVTRSGMESQLLGLTIQKEQPELERQKSTLLKQEEELKVEVAALERSLLQSLATSKGNLLENKELLDSLNETKSKSSTISTSLEESHQLQVTLDQQRNMYSPIAQRGSTMYFLVRDLVAINHMYQVSLAVFLDIFKRALEAEDHSTDVSSRLAVLNATLLRMVYSYVSRSLFNADRLTLGMHMAHSLAPDQCPGDEWDLFVGKLVANEAALAQAVHQKPAWVPEESAAAYAQLATAFPQLAGKCDLGNQALWSPWLQTGEAERELPQGTSGQLTSFQVLLIVQAFRPDRLQSAMSSFVCSTLAMRSIDPEPFSLKSLHQGEMRPQEPVLFIASPGADPSQELSDFAERTVGRNRYHEVAMGQGQGALAIDLLRSCARAGDWLCLKNLHLVVSWLPTLEKEIHSLTPNPEFRLFLTSEPHNKFPSSLLEGCLKVTFEAPPGLKKNLIRTYEFWTPEYVSQGTPVRAQLLFALAWFHAVVQERRTYIPQGWSKFYEFSFADLRSGADIINLSTQEGRSPQWEYLHGLLENAIYGGRVDNPFDLKVLNTYLEQYFSPEVVAISGGRVKALPGTKSMVLPSSNHHGDYLALIKSLPEADTPSIFSLPANIDRAAQQANSTLVVGQLKAMAVASSTAGGFSRVLWSRQLAPLLKLWDQLMTANSGLRQPLRPVAGTESWGPIEAFVALERTNASRLVSTIDRMMGRLSRVLRGTDGLSPEVQQVGQELMQDEVPLVWESLWEGPAAPLAYCRAVVSRAVAVDQWFARAQQGQVLQAGTLDLADLFNPVTFLNALRQQSARQLQTSVDNLRLVTSWDQGRLRSPVMASIGGMLIQGANFDGARISPARSDAPTSSGVPPAMVAWIPKDEPHPYVTNFAVVPLYVTADRTSLLAEVQMPVTAHDEKVQWTLSGVAMFLAA